MIKVLIAEDELPLLRGIKIMIERAHSEFSVVKCALNGKEAVDYLSEHEVDVLFTDINMPLLDGIGLMDFVFKNAPQTIMVVLSGYDDFHYARQAIDYQVKKYLLKPIVMEDLEILLKEVHCEYLKCSQKREKEKIVEMISGSMGEKWNQNFFRKRAVSQKEGTEELVHRMEVYIREHLTEQITVSKLAKEFGLVAPYLGKIFKSYTGFTPNSYIQELRIEYAKYLLWDNQEILAKDVAEMVGYTDAAYFSKLFKKKVGMWPSQYREKQGL